MKLPGFDRAIVDPVKLQGYLLSECRPVGRFKARFSCSLGFRAENAEEFEAAIRDLLVRFEPSGVLDTAYGRKYLVSGELEGPARKSARVTTVWIVGPGQEVPRFVTAYPEAGR